MTKPKYLTIEDLTSKELWRLLTKIEFDKDTGCLNWTGALTEGYGKFVFRNKKIHAHRFMFAWFFGPIPEGRGRDIPILDHIVCNNRRCCNPYHLELSTHKKNVLRSESPSGINHRKFLCSRGHPLPVKPNLSNGKRYCKICARLYKRSEEQQEHRRIKSRERYYRNRAEILKRMARNRAKKRETSI